MQPKRALFSLDLFRSLSRRARTPALIAAALALASSPTRANAASTTPASKAAGKISAAPPAAPASAHAEPVAETRAAAAPDVPDDLRELVRRYGNTRSANFFDVTTDGNFFLIGTRFGEARQIHILDTPLGERTQVSFGEEPVHAARFLPQEPNIVLYLQDSFGNQNYQLYKLERDTGRVTRLSDGKTRIDDLLLARDGRRLSWSASTDGGANSAVFVAESDSPTTPRRLTPLTGTWRPLDFSPTGHTILVAHERSRGDAELFAVPVDGSVSKLEHAAADAGTASTAAAPEMFEPGKKLWPPDGTSSLRTASYSADGHDLFLVTDHFSNAQELVRIDPDHPEQPAKRITQSLDWDVDVLAASQDRGAPAAAAITVVQDGYDRMYLLEPGTFLLMPVALPPGVVTSLRFPTVRSDILCIGLQSPRRPQDVYQLDVRSRRVLPWTRSELGPIDPVQLLEPERVSWLSLGEQIPALIYRPHNDTGAKLPVLLALHDGLDGEGGPGSSVGSVSADDLARPGFDGAAQLYANELGVAVLSPSVRGAWGLGKKFLGASGDAHARREAQLRDVAASLDWIAAQPDLDATRVVVMSDSTGLAEASAAAYATRIRGAVPSAMPAQPKAAQPIESVRVGSAMLLEKKRDRDAGLGATLLFLREKLLGYPKDAKAEPRAESKADPHPPEPAAKK